MLSAIAVVFIHIHLSNAFSKNLLPKLCETRWSARVDALSVILAKNKAILAALEDVNTESTILSSEEQGLGVLYNLKYDEQ
jgi:hypothetical protein